MLDPHYTDDRVTIWRGDCLNVLTEMPDKSVDAIVTDPPYGLGFMGKDWDDLPPGLPWAQECLRVLKPGGHLIAFGGTRTWHRLAVAVEDAGFEMRDSIAWLYGSGFPKSLDVSKAIDKAGGNPLAFREFARAYAAAVKASGRAHDEVDRHLGIRKSSAYWAREDHRRGLPPRHHWEAVRDLLGLDAEFERLYDEAERAVIGQKTAGIGTAFGDGQWANGPSQVVDITAPATPAAQQWAGWGTALKPAFEPIVVARKPLVGTVAANVLAHGTGALNIDGTRVETPDGKPAWDYPNGAGGHAFKFSVDAPNKHGAKTGPAGRWPTNVVLDGDAAAELDEQSGPLRARGDVTPTTAGGGLYGLNVITVDHGAGDTGGASRFFPVFKYQAKAPTRERPTYVTDDGTEVAHPTVKPLGLMRWLVRLVTPAGGTVLDTFAGSGATVEAAIEEGFYALGIERETNYLPLIMERLARVAAKGSTPLMLPFDGAGESPIA